MDHFEADNTISILNRSTKKKTTMERIGNRCNYFHEIYYSKSLTDPIFFRQVYWLRKRTNER